MSNNVISVDFGREYNEAARRLGRLMGLVEKRQAELQKDPTGFLDAAYEQMRQLRGEMEAVSETMFPPLPLTFASPEREPAFHPLETVVVTREDYGRMKRAEAIVASWRGKGLTR